MKKNKMMRIASVLLVLTLISTCAISGTFAKYVTKASGEDSARVAKWGVVLTLEGADSVFATQYDTSAEHEEYEGLAVKSDVKVVAPGTNSEEAGAAVEGKVAGTPEVATHYEISIKDIKDVFLPEGEYTDYTELVKNDNGEYGYFNTFEVGENGYAPVVWDLTIGSVTVKAKSLSEVLRRADEIADKLSSMGTVAVEAGDDSITITMDVEPGTEMDLNFKLAWAWEYGEFEGVSENDKADTFLGNLAFVELGGEIEDFEAPDDASIEVAATVEVLAVQID